MDTKEVLKIMSKDRNADLVGVEATKQFAEYYARG